MYSKPLNNYSKKIWHHFFMIIRGPTFGSTTNQRERATPLISAASPPKIFRHNSKPDHPALQGTPTSPIPSVRESWTGGDQGTHSAGGGMGRMQPISLQSLYTWSDICKDAKPQKDKGPLQAIPCNSQWGSEPPDSYQWLIIQLGLQGLTVPSLIGKG